MKQALGKSGWEVIKVSALHNVLDGKSLIGYKYERENKKKSPLKQVVRVFMPSAFCIYISPSYIHELHYEEKVTT